MKLLSIFLIGLGLGLAAEGRGLPDCRKSGEARIAPSEPYSSFRARINRPACEKDWTVLLYMAADNDLFPYALSDIYEMEAAFRESKSAGSTAKIDLVVEIDGPAQQDLRRLHIFSSPEVYQAKRPEEFRRASLEDIRSPVVEIVGEQPRRSQKESFEKFLLWGAKNYPSRNYMVIVWGHGQGWKAYPVQNPSRSRFLIEESLPAKFPSAFTDRAFGGIGFRQSTGTSLDIPSLKAALSSFRRATGKAVDVYASDSCLMQMVEVAYEISSEARFVVGSTQLQNFLGLPYRRLFYELNNGSFLGQRSNVRGSVDANDEPLLLARMIPSLSKQSLDPQRGLQGKAEKEAQNFMTSSAVSSSELRQFLVPALANLSASLRSYLQEDRMRVIDLQFVMQQVPHFQGSAQDLGIFLGYLDLLLLNERAKNGSLSSAASRLQTAVALSKQALDRSVISYAYGKAYGLDPSTHALAFVPRAISLWLPVDPREHALRRSEFAASEFFRDTGWNAWLDLVFPR